LLVVVASAGQADAALSKDAQKCVNELNKNLRKVTKTIGKEYRRCIKSGAKQQLGGQTVTDCFAADNGDKIQKAKDKTQSGFDAKCIADFPSFGATDVATVNQAAEDKEVAIVEGLFGGSVNAAIITLAADSFAAKCQDSVYNSTLKCQDAQMKEFAKCKRLALKGGAMTTGALDNCVGDDPKGKIAKTCNDIAKPDKIRKSLDKKCVAKAVDLSTAFPGCGVAGNLEATHACITASVNCEVCRAINTADGIESDCDLYDDGDGDNDSCDSGVPRASARIVDGPEDLIGGLLARGRDDDFIIENGVIRVIIQKPGRDLAAGIGAFGGNPIDADLYRAGDPGRDLFEEWVMLINIENTANYTDVVVLNDGTDGNAAVIRATGPDDLLDMINASSVVMDFGFPFPAALNDTDQPVEVSTDYILERDSTSLRMESTLTNTSGATITLLLGDYLSSLAQEIFEPGYGFGEPLVTEHQACAASPPCDFVAYSDDGEKGGVSYGYVHEVPASSFFNTDGVQVSLLGRRAVLTLIGGQGPNFPIAAGESFTITRHLVVGDGDVASIVTERNRIKGLDVGTVRGEVTSGGLPVAEADVAVLGAPADGPGTALNVVSHFRTDENGEYEGTLPVGTYDLRVNKDGYLFGAPDPGNVVVSSGGTVVQNFTLPATSTVSISVEDHNTDPIAARVTLIGFDPSPDPGNTQSILGLINNNTNVFGRLKDPAPFGVARMHFIDPSGAIEFPLEPTDYQVVVSHGTEYSADLQDLTAVAGMTHNLSATVAPVVDTSGFISADMHVHSLDSVDSPVTRRDRIISMIAEGVDFFTPSDHGFRVDFTQDVLDLGVEQLVATAVNNEITTFDYGHFNGYPVTIDPNKVSGGSVDRGGAAPPGEDFPSLGHYVLSPGEIFDAVLADPGEEAVQINHVASFFDGGLRFDTGLTPPESTGNPVAMRLDPGISNFWDEDFTSLEVWIQTAAGSDASTTLGQNFGNWFNLLNQGIVKTAVGNSDTHDLVRYGSGWPRTMIASSTDDPFVIDPEAIAMNQNDGRAVATNGPFMRVSVDGDFGETGGLALGENTVIKATGGSATVTVDIQSPPWAEFDTVEYYINSETIADSTDRGALPPLYRICPDVVQTAPGDFTISSMAVNGSSRFEATSVLSLVGLVEDTWVVAIVRGTAGVSCPLFPVRANDLDEDENPTLADLKTCDVVDDGGTLAMAFSNPIFLDVDGNGSYDAPGVAFQGSCP
jgi:hypothetical protein